MDITEVSIVHHVAIVLLLIWFLSSFSSCHPLVYVFSFIYLYLVHENFVTRFRRKVRFEERRQANQKRVLSDSESVRWLNHLVENVWPICMEKIVLQQILLPIIPWFLEKYKPWTVKEAMVQNLYMGRLPPMITEMRVCRQSTGDDHLVLELGLNFKTAEDMSAILAVKLTKRLGFGMSAKMHLTGMHVEGKVLVGIRFLPKWPFLKRLRVCFVEPPYFQMTVKPIFSHGLDVTEIPGIAGWLDKLFTVVFQETLVEPNMLVVDVEKFVSPEPQTWFSVDAKEPVGYVLVEIVEGSDMKPSDMNGLADPYVKGQLGAYRFRTKTQKKTLSPKWYEEFKLPVVSWDSPNVLQIGVRDKDHIFDDTLGDCCVRINKFRDGERHDMWLPLENIKMGRLHLAIRVIEAREKVFEQQGDDMASTGEFKKEEGSVKLPEKSRKMDTEDGMGQLPEKSKKMDAEHVLGEFPEESDKMGVDHFEPINVEGQRETGIWVHHPGADVAQVWEPRKGKNRVRKDSESVASSIRSEPFPNDSSSTDESVDDSKPKSRNMVKRGFRKVGSFFNRSPRPESDKDKLRSYKRTVDEDSELHENVRAENEKKIGVKLVMENPKVGFKESPESPEKSDMRSPDKRKVRDSVKGVLKNTGNSARGLMHHVSRKGSGKGRDTDLVVEVDSPGAVGPVESPEYRADDEVSQNGPGQMESGKDCEVSPSGPGQMESGKDGEVSLNDPGQMESGEAATSVVCRAGEVNVDDPDGFRIDGADMNAVDKAEEDDSRRAGAGDEVISSPK